MSSGSLNEETASIPFLLAPGQLHNVVVAVTDCGYAPGAAAWVSSPGLWMRLSIADN